MKKIILCLLILLGQVHAQDNGGSGIADWFKKYKDLGGTDIGGGNDSAQFYSNWCLNAINTLETYQENANLQLMLTGNYAQSNIVLRDGLAMALATESESENSLITHTALERALNLWSVLQNVARPEVDADQRTLYFVLTKIYKFISNTVSENLDLKITVPLLRGQRISVDEFEKRFVNYVYEQLSFVHKTLLQSRVQEGYVEYYPVGNVKFYFFATELFLNYSLSDLKESLWKDYYSCTLVEMNSLVKRLQSYNLGQRSIYGNNDRIAANLMAKKMDEILLDLLKMKGCQR